MTDDLRREAIAKCEEAIAAARKAEADASVYLLELALIELGVTPTQQSSARASIGNTVARRRVQKR
jgi:hypothetical protein